MHALEAKLIRSIEAYIIVADVMGKKISIASEDANITATYKREQEESKDTKCSDLKDLSRNSVTAGAIPIPLYPHPRRFLSAENVHSRTGEAENLVHMSSSGTSGARVVEGSQKDSPDSTVFHLSPN
jgi:hypothetical protein